MRPDDPSPTPPSRGHYFDHDPASESARHEVSLDLPDVSLRLVADRGVFAGTAAQVDTGTRLLLQEAAHPPAGVGQLLDLGCGYGAIACALAARAPGATVWAVDVNERALELTAASAEANGLANVRTASPADVPEDVRFAGIWSNPPIRIGKRPLHDLLGAWLPRLDDGASAWLVVQRNLGADSLARWLQGQGWVAERRTSRVGYRVLEVARG